MYKPPTWCTTGHLVTQQAIWLCMQAAVGHPCGTSTLCNFIGLIEYRPLDLSLLVVRVLDELDDDILAWLDLQHLEDQAEERGWLDVPTKDSTHMVKVHRLVNQQLGCEETHACRKDRLGLRSCGVIMQITTNIFIILLYFKILGLSQHLKALNRDFIHSTRSKFYSHKCSAAKKLDFVLILGFMSMKFRICKSSIMSYLFL